MAEVIRLPEVLTGTTEGAIQTWLVQPGGTVAIGDTLAEVETEKAVVELTAEVDGTLGRLLVEEGQNIVVGDAIAVMLAAGESDDAIAAALSAAGVAGSESDTGSAPPPAEQPTDAGRPEPSGGGEAPERLFASPIVRKLARENAVDLQRITGTGPNGRIVRRDLERYLETVGREEVAPSPAPEPTPTPTRAAASPQVTPTGAGWEDVPVDRMRRAIARRLTESKSTVPHFYLEADCRVDALLALRTQINADAPRKISVNDFVLKAAAAALVEVPAANAIWNGDTIRRFKSVDIAVAVATDGGLVTPVLRGVDTMTLSAISASVAELAERGRAGKLRQHELEGGSFSVSNLGMYGTARFAAILNPPQSGILAVGAARAMPVVAADGGIESGAVMTVTLSADHRVVDGAVAAEWMSAFKRRVEAPLTTLI